MKDEEQVLKPQEFQTGDELKKDRKKKKNNNIESVSKVLDHQSQQCSLLLMLYVSELHSSKRYFLI